MVRLSLMLMKRGVRAYNPNTTRHIKMGPWKWRDFKSEVIEPPYWYKWSMHGGPYHPLEQRKMSEQEKAMKFSYKKNYPNYEVTEPDKWMIFEGDLVEILKGKDAGKRGKVTKIIPQRNWVVVGGLNCKYVSTKGEILADPMPLYHGDVKLIDPKTEEATDCEYKVTETGKSVRVSKSSGYIIPKPREMLWSGTYKEEYENNGKDTLPEEATQRTYQPVMLSWEDELKQLYGFDDPHRRKSFWY